jgi:hypothetical protein
MISVNGYKVVDSNGSFLTSTVFATLEEANRFISQCESNTRIIAIPTKAAMSPTGKISEFLTERL